uniref:DNA helicase n=1 Tax=Phascolarctos cinereus TaxID=38626 RepID=A0A6P5JXE6_PHACI|nr:transcriptional regulator ATRX-like [Phascolarctos cinereus]
MSENINCNSEGIGEQCRWCAERGNLICCDSCDNAFCKKCISRNLGKKEISKIMDENNQWQCYICHPEPLLDLVAVCDCVFEDISLLRQQNKKKLKSASEKSGKTCNHPPKFYSTTKEEEKPQLDDFHSDAVTHSFSSLMVSKDLITKTETLLENTTVMKSSFVTFSEQIASNSEMSSNTMLNQLKGVRSVRNDISKAHKALEECLNKEISSLVVKEKKENSKEGKHENAKKDAKIKNVDKKYEVEDIFATKTKRFPNDKTDAEIIVPTATTGEVKNTNEFQYEPACTSKSLDMDILSIPSSRPEDIFENQESSINIQNDENTEIYKDTENSLLETNESSKLILLVKKTEEEYQQESSIPGNTEVIPDNDTALFNEETDLQRSPLVKTTSSIGHIEKELVTSNSEESGEKRKPRSSGQWEKEGRQVFLPDAEEKFKLINKETSSDADEKSALWKEAAKEDKSSSESDTDLKYDSIQKKIVYKAKHHELKDHKGKRKREDSTYNSDNDNKKGEVSENPKKQQEENDILSSSDMWDSGDETNTTSVPVLMEEDDDDPENWITKKTLLEEIKANFSSDESEESDDTKNITEKKDETNTRSEGICEKSNLKSDSDSEEIKKLKYRSPLVTYNLNISGGESAEETKESKHRKKRKVSMDDSD